MSSKAQDLDEDCRVREQSSTTPKDLNGAKIVYYPELDKEGQVKERQRRKLDIETQSNGVCRTPLFSKLISLRDFYNNVPRLGSSK